MIIIKHSPGKSRSDLQKIRNCLFFCAYSPRLKDKLLQKQAKELLSNNKELFPCERIGPWWRPTRALTRFLYRHRWDHLKLEVSLDRGELPIDQDQVIPVFLKTFPGPQDCLGKHKAVNSSSLISSIAKNLTVILAYLSYSLKLPCFSLGVKAWLKKSRGVNELLLPCFLHFGVTRGGQNDRNFV